MSLSPLVLEILAVCWILPAIVVVVKYGREWYRASRSSPNEMDLVHKDVTVRMAVSSVSDSERTMSVQSSQSYVGSTRPRVSTSVRHVTVPVPYAEISVPVYDGNGDVCVRRCSLSVN